MHVQWSLSTGAGARRLGEARTRAAIQLLLVQTCGEIFHVHGRRLAADALTGILDVVKQLADHARQVDKDMQLRRQLAAAQAQDKVRSLQQHNHNTGCYKPRIETAYAPSFDGVYPSHASCCAMHVSAVC